MSILIKGASSLKEGLYQVQDGKIHAYKGNGGKVQEFDLVEVPTPHGHLIDSAELLSAKFAGIYHDPIVSDGVEKTDKEVYAYRVGWNDALDAAYLNAPIVISAEREEE